MDIYKRIGIVCRHIPVGKVATYGQIALRLSGACYFETYDMQKLLLEGDGIEVLPIKRQRAD